MAQSRTVAAWRHAQASGAKRARGLAAPPPEASGDALRATDTAGVTARRRGCGPFPPISRAARPLGVVAVAPVRARRRQQLLRLLRARLPLGPSPEARRGALQQRWVRDLAKPGDQGRGHPDRGAVLQDEAPTPAHGRGRVLVQLRALRRFQPPRDGSPGHVHARRGAVLHRRGVSGAAHAPSRGPRARPAACAGEDHPRPRARVDQDPGSREHRADQDAVQGRERTGASAWRRDLAARPLARGYEPRAGACAR